MKDGAYRVSKAILVTARQFFFLGRGCFIVDEIMLTVSH